jgi:HK97 family phage major capsid protein
VAYNDQVTRSDASALIPEDVSREIIQDLPRASVALSKFRRATMSRKQQRMPVLAALPTAFFVNGDTGLRQTTKQAWDNKYLNAEELAVIVPIPKAVLEDSEFDMWAEIRPRLVESLGQAIDGATLFGTNKPASWPDAVEDGAAAAGNTLVRGATAGQDLAGDVNKVMGLVEADGFMVGGHAAAPTFKAALRGLRDTQGGLLFQPSLQAGTPGTLYGENIHYVDNGSWDPARADLIAGDWSQAIVALREDINYTMLDQAVIQDNTGAIIYNLAQQGMVALMVEMRVAYQIANPITRLNTGSTRYPFAVLRPAGFV